MIVQGGRSDPTGGYTYSSAPLIDETLVLLLQNDFDLETSPWELADGVRQGVAWHSTGYLEEDSGNGYLVSFGGDGGPTLPVQTNNDSLGLSFITGPDMVAVDVSGSGQPMRRWYPSSGSIDKKSWLMSGGLKGDGSGLGFNDVYSVTLTANNVDFQLEGSLPTDLAGHSTLVLPDGTVWLVGGWIPSSGQFLTLDKAYSRSPGGSDWAVKDLTSTATAVPLARRGSSLVLVSASKAILYGGSTSVSTAAVDSSSVLGDMWELDLELGLWSSLLVGQSSNNVSKRAAVVGPGGRFEHAAVGVDGKVLIFGGESRWKH